MQVANRDHRSRLQESLDSANLLAYQCPAAAPMEAAKIYFIVFGALTIAGGTVGYLKAGSVASIIAGSITGVLLAVAAFLLTEYSTIGLATALIVALLHAAQFVLRFLRSG